jgi:hypothetical protein
MINSPVSFPIYLTNSLVKREELEKKFSHEIFIIHTGHILKPDLPKLENEKNLEILSSNGINLVNLTLEDFIIADFQGINFENYNQAFLNSSVIDLSLDALISAKNISSYAIHGTMAFVGLSDKNLDDKSNIKYIVDDYVLSILKVKKTALKSNLSAPITSFIIIHTLGTEINDVMTRLPPLFINSLAN